MKADFQAVGRDLVGELREADAAAVAVPWRQRRRDQTDALDARFGQQRLTDAIEERRQCRIGNVEGADGDTKPREAVDAVTRIERRHVAIRGQQQRAADNERQRQRDFDGDEGRRPALFALRLHRAARRAAQYVGWLDAARKQRRRDVRR